jgi:8-oxo-dGTP pyrophosphatase MutT (NUDIX family)
MAELACAVPYRYVDGELQFLLITSRKKGAWIFPKGHIGNGESARSTAEKEAWEEAGVLGTLEETPVETFDQATEDGIEATEVYLLRVEELAQRWPERKERKRRWTRIEKVPKFIKKSHLRSVMEQLGDPSHQ